MKIGVSCGTNDLHLISLFAWLHTQKKIDYIELYIREDASVWEMRKWKFQSVPLVFHAPHDDQADTWADQMELADEFRSHFPHASMVYDSISGTHFNFEDVLPETMPMLTRCGDKSLFCLPTEFEEGKFCMDFAHCFITANLLGTDVVEFYKAFLRKKPAKFHLSDLSTHYADDHKPLLEGVLPVKEIVRLIPKGSAITLEVDHEIEHREKAIIDEVEKVRKLFKL